MAEANVDFARPSAAQLKTAAAISTATMHEAGGKIGALPSGIKQAHPSFEVCGPAFPVMGPPGDNLWLHRGIALAKPGDVLVISVNGHYEAGYWGEIMSQAALARKLGGVVIDGCARDGALLEELGFPVFARGLCIRGTGKDQTGVGAINHPVRIGNIVVFGGDLVLGDSDGLVVVPRADLADVIAKSRAREEKEAHIIGDLQAGKRTLDLYGWTEAP